MMSNSENPWQGMGAGSQRLVDDQSLYDIYWVTDVNGNYGFLIKTTGPVGPSAKDIKLKGVELIHREFPGQYNELILLLTSRSEWQIFAVLCRDLLEAAKRQSSEEGMLTAVRSRLQRWQKLLKQDLSGKLSIQAQMGLFGELTALKEIIAPSASYIGAVTSWTGPERDKQDFITERSAVEIKSYLVSKGPSVRISSALQLFPEKQFGYLVCYGLSISEGGQTAGELASEIANKLEEESENAKALFESRLVEYGFAVDLPLVHLEKFSVDSLRCFELIEGFPRIPYETIPNGVESVSYAVNLMKCADFEIESGLMTF